MRHTLFYGDCAEVMRAWPDACVDALVTDPPAGIGFMNKAWDKDKGGMDAWVQWLAGAMGEARRVLKPGAHGLVWALPRTSHWTALALERAGFEVRDRVTHIFGTGFPKSKNDIAEGLGTALKPAAEDWWLVRKPLEGTLEATYRQWGTGVLNIDACIIPGTDNLSAERRRAAVARGGVLRESGTWANDRRSAETYCAERPREALGRWPAHLVLDDFAAAQLDAQTGKLPKAGGIGAHTAAAAAARGQVNAMGPHTAPRGEWEPYGDEGGPSRFFFRYVAKPSKRERDYGCEGLPVRSSGAMTDREEGSAGLKSPRAGAGRTGGARNHHPTLKSIELMRWLVRLITPPNGLVLDPFAGSGTTGIAALQEGRRFCGIERELEYLAVAAARVGAAERDVPREEGEDEHAAAAHH